MSLNQYLSQVFGILDLCLYLVPQRREKKQSITFSLIAYISTEFSQQALKYDFAHPLLPFSLASVLEEKVSESPVAREAHTHTKAFASTDFNRIVRKKSVKF